MVVDVDEIIESIFNEESIFKEENDDTEIVEEDDNDNDNDGNNDNDDKARRSNRKTTTTDRLSISSMTTKIYDVSTTDDPASFLRFYHVKEEIKQSGFRVLKNTDNGFIECDADDQNGFDSDDDNDNNDSDIVTFKIKRAEGVRRKQDIVGSLYDYSSYSYIIVHPNGWDMMKWGGYDQMLEGVHFFVRYSFITSSLILILLLYLVLMMH